MLCCGDDEVVEKERDGRGISAECLAGNPGSIVNKIKNLDCAWLCGRGVGFGLGVAAPGVDSGGRCADEWSDGGG